MKCIGFTGPVKDSVHKDNLCLIPPHLVTTFNMQFRHHLLQAVFSDSYPHPVCAGAPSMTPP